MTLVKMSDSHLTNHDLRTIKVLVVDDDPIIRKFLEMTLNDLHVHSIRSCADGFSALKVMAGYAPSVILTDIHMKLDSAKFSLLFRLFLGQPQY